MPLAPDPSLVLQTLRGVGSDPIRVGIAFDSPAPARWIVALIDLLRVLPAVEAVAYMVHSDRFSGSSNGAFLAHWLCASTHRVNPFEAALGVRGHLSWETAEARRCDVIIWLTSGIEAGPQPTSMPANGIFTVAFGNRSQEIPFWDEVSGAQATSKTTIYWHDSSLAVGRPVRQLETSTSQGLNIGLNYEAPVVGVIRLLAGLCVDLQQDRDACMYRMRVMPTVTTVAVPSAALHRWRKSGTLLFESCCAAQRCAWACAAYKHVVHRLVRPNASKSIVGPNVPDVADFRELPLVAGSGQMADPFLYETGGRTYLLFEDVPVGSTRGRLGCVEIFADGRYCDFVVILERKYHLSYPCVFESEGETYMIPESSERNGRTSTVLPGFR